VDGTKVFFVPQGIVIKCNMNLLLIVINSFRKVKLQEMKYASWLDQFVMLSEMIAIIPFQ